MATSQSVDGKTLEEPNIHGLLTRLFIQTKTRQWKILSDAAFSSIWTATRTFYQHKFSINDVSPYLTLKQTYSRFSDPDHNRLQWTEARSRSLTNLSIEYPYVSQLLDHFRGRIIAAGGAIYKILNGIHKGDSDIDLFFVDPDIENDGVAIDVKMAKADAVLKEAVSYLTQKWMVITSPEIIFDEAVTNRYVLVTRNQFVTTVNLMQDHRDFAKIQFIHRVYPNAGSILGGFDLTSCMVGFDGHRFLGIEIGTWSALGNFIIVDTSRRSTSFEHRLQKYGKYCHLIFPGLPKTVRPEHVKNWISLHAAKQFVHKTISDAGFEIVFPKENGRGKLFPTATTADYAKKREVIQLINDIVNENGFRLDNFRESQLAYVPRGEAERRVLLEKLRLEMFSLGYLFDMKEYLQDPYSSGQLGFRPLDIILKLPYADIKVAELGPPQYGCRRWNLRVPKNPQLKYTPIQTSDYAGWEIGGLSDSARSKVSDYDDSPTTPTFAVLTNTSLLIRGHLSGVTSVAVILSKGADLKDLVYRDWDDQESAYIGLRECVTVLDLNVSISAATKTIENGVAQIFDTVNLGNVQGVIDSYLSRYKGTGTGADDREREFLFAPRIERTTYHEEDFGELKSRVSAQMHVVAENLQRPNWILRNAGRQWTSSINPIMANPRDWYGKDYQSFRVGNAKTETCLRLLRLSPGNCFSGMPRDIFGYLMGFIMWADSYHQ
jgi:hypothetical protein